MPFLVLVRAGWRFGHFWWIESTPFAKHEPSICYKRAHIGRILEPHITIS